MKTQIQKLFLALVLFPALDARLSTARAQGTAFSYQGSLNVSGNPANGNYDVRFTVCDALTNGNIIAGPLTNTATPVSNGLFAVTLDFGGGVFTGPARWMQLDVRTNGNGAFTLLSPREPVLPEPYAIMANSASNLLGTVPATQLSGALAQAQLPGSVLTNNQSGVTLSGTFSGNGSGLTNLTNGIPHGTIVLSQTPGNGALSSAGFAPLVTLPGVTWTLATTNASWPGRYSFPSVTFNGQMWVLGDGFSSSAIWSSSNGVTWTEATNTSPWVGTLPSSAVVFSGKIWVFGGYGVWSSPDGTNWTQVTTTPPWNGTQRYEFSLVAFNGKIWLLGGVGPGTPGTLYNDVWSSPDGANWTEVTSNAPWSPRWGHTSVIFNGLMWVMGGDLVGTGSYVLANDVWSSPDGVNWTRTTAAAQWAGRDRFASLALNSQMFVLGGMSVASGGNTNDVWSSFDGTNWTQATSAASWSPRFGLGALTFNGGMWVLGGYSDFAPNYNNDAWFSQNETNMLGSYYLFQKQ